MEKIEFTYNWNNKLDCRSFSTVRLANSKKYVLLDDYQVYLKTKGNGPDIYKGLAKLQHIRRFNLFEVTPDITFLDANLNIFEFQKLLTTMYKNKLVDFRTQPLYFMIFQYYKIHETEKQKALEFAQNS